MAEEGIIAMKPIADFIKGKYTIVRNVVNDVYVVKYASTCEHKRILDCFKKSSPQFHDRETPAREQVEISRIYLVKKITGVYARGVVISVDDEVLYRIWYVDEDKYDVVSLGRIKVADDFDEIAPIYQVCELTLELEFKDPATVLGEYGPTFEEDDDDNNASRSFSLSEEQTAVSEENDDDLLFTQRIRGSTSSNNDVPTSGPSSSSPDGPKNLETSSAKNPSVIDDSVPSKRTSIIKDAVKKTIEVIYEAYEGVEEGEYTSADSSSSTPCDTPAKERLSSLSMTSSMTSSTEELSTSTCEYTDPESSLYVPLK